MTTGTTVVSVPSAATTHTAPPRRVASARLGVLLIVELAAIAASIYGVVRAGDRYLVSLPLALVAAVWIALIGFTLQSVNDETRAR
ncbi:MAG: hypothetical protein EPO40_06335 [Myxococcaceae bacterium]|nr:MAG: hypothetical protein EPO40_06335 [Myxococcaceae bacterium]